MIIKVNQSTYRYSVFRICIVIVIVIFLGQFCPKGKGAMRLTLCEAPTWEGNDQTTTPGTRCPTLFDKFVGSLKSPANNVTLRMQQTGPMVYSPISEKT